MLRLFGRRRDELALEARVLTLHEQQTVAASIRARLETQLEAEREALRLMTFERDKWERRACSLLDQFGLRDGILSAPALSEPAAPRRDPVKNVMTALGVTTRRPIASPAAAPVDGVDMDAAARAVTEVLGR